MSQGSCVRRILRSSILVFGPPAPRAAAFSARVVRGHHADFAATPRAGAAVFVMFVAAGTARGIASRQWQARRVRRQETLARESIGRSTGSVAWNYRHRVELRFRRRLGGRLLLQPKQLAQRPFGHRCHRIRAGRTCIRGEATTLFLRRGRKQLLQGACEFPIDAATAARAGTPPDPRRAPALRRARNR